MSGKAKIKASKKAAVAEQDFAKTLNAKKVPALRKMCNDLDIEDCTGLKADLIIQIIDAKALASEGEEMIIEVPKKKKAKAPKAKVSKAKAKETKAKASKAKVSKAKVSKAKTKASKAKASKAKVSKTKASKAKAKVSKKKELIIEISEDDVEPEIVAVKKSKVGKKSPAKKSKVGKKSPAKKSPAKKSKVGKKSPAKKSKVGKKKDVKKTESVYAGKTISALKLLCKKRGIDAEKCALVYDELIAVLEEYDSLHASDMEVTVVKAKVSKKGKSKKPKEKRCDDSEDPLLCEEGEICYAKTGKCVDGEKGKYSHKLTIDDRVIFGTKATLLKLQGILGGDISLPASKAKKGVKGKAKPKEMDIVFVEEEEVTEGEEVVDEVVDEEVVEEVVDEEITEEDVADEDMSPEEQETMKKYRKDIIAFIKKKKPSPTLQGKLDDLLNEEENDEEIKTLSSAIKKMKSPDLVVKKTPSPKKTTPLSVSPKPPIRGSTKVELKKQEIFETFQKCLESLSV